MSDFNVSRIGQADGTGDATALFLKVFPGEVMGAFNETNKMEALHVTRTIASGKSAQFPAIGKTTASYHTPGNLIVGQNILQNERVINIDSLLLSDAFVSNIDEAMTHFDVRGEYAKQLGEALALQYDKNLMQVVALAARASATVSGGDGGSSVTNAAAKTDGDILAGLIFDAGEDLDDRSVSEMDRYCILKPAQYNLLVQTTKVINRDWGGSGAYADGTVLKVDGISIVKSVNLPTGVVSATTGENNTYNGDFSKTAGLVFHRSAVGTVKLLDLAVEKEYLIQNQGTLMVAKYAVGHGILRPESAVEIATP